MAQKRTRTVAVGVALSTVMLAACDKPPELSTTPRIQPRVSSRALAVRGSTTRRPDEDLFVVIGREVPEFAGYYLAPDRSIVALISDSAYSGDLRAVLQRQLAANRLGLPSRFAAGQITIKKVDYSFQQLSEWRDSVTSQILGKMDGVVFDDLDEVRNRVTIGVLKSRAAAARTAVLERFAAYGIPAQAVYFEELESSPRSSATSATETTPSTPPLAAGYLNSDADTLLSGFGISQFGLSALCTLGLVLDRNGTRYVSTASHCGTRQFALDNTDLWATNNYGTSIGAEAWDTTTANRRADLSLITVAMPSLRGTIARTVSRDSGFASTRQIYSALPFIFIYGTASPIVGLPVDKVGRTTGWTHGTIVSTCADWWNRDNGLTTKCEIRASAFGAGGDSGGPLFSWDGYDGAALIGVSQSAVDSTGTQTIDGVKFTTGPVTWHSSYSGLINDMGSTGLVVTRGTTVGSFTLSGTISSGSPSLSWTTPSISNGNPNGTSYFIYRSTYAAGVFTESDYLMAAYYGSTALLDATRSVTSYNGTTFPTHGNYVSYRVAAYNAGVTAQSATVYFRMP